ncbi:MAG: hypothetical protein HRT47_12090 [Candidatus Caenarcaniphilales bacterium]|nr:hypothetical protein [Candidatus Caenarcaniphilales bacterium]
MTFYVSLEAAVRIKNQKNRAKFKLSKKGKKNFILSPKNGRVIIEIKDGEIIPAELTITAKKSSDEVITDYQILAPKKLRKKLNIENYSSTLYLSDDFIFSFQVAIPVDDLDKFPFVSRLEENQAQGQNFLCYNQDDSTAANNFDFSSQAYTRFSVSKE